jgi:hypothetical protein
MSDTDMDVAGDFAVLGTFTRPGVRHILDYIDAWMATTTCIDAVEFWDVITAMRGPDFGADGPLGDVQFKADTTAVLRNAAFPRTMAIGHRGSSNVWYGKVGCMVSNNPLNPDPVPPGHFRKHLRSAATALGLIRR